MKKLTLLSTFILIPFLSICQIINVPNDYPSIQQGIDAAMVGDTVLVDTGTYVENINFNGKNITVSSHYLTTLDASYILQTVIDGDSSGSVVIFENSEDSTALLCGFTITNGSGSYSWSGGRLQKRGGGILLINGSSPRLMNLTITGNIAESGNGAGICCWHYSHPLIENVIVIDNDGTGSDSHTNDGCGGISLSNSSPTLKNVLITNNEGLMAGGIFCNENSNPLLINVTISNNIAYTTPVNNDVAELISWQGSHPILLNTIIWNNDLTKISVRDNEISIGYSNIQGGAIEIENHGIIHWLEGNIDQNPMFVDFGEHPYQINDYSPCIDAGTPDTSGLNLPEFDLAGEVRIYNDRIDMGAYEINMFIGINESNFILNELSVQSSPNPFTTSTTLTYELKQPEQVTLTIYDYLGKQVFQKEENHTQGSQQLIWNAEGYADGIYYYRLQVGDAIANGKMVKVR